MVKLDVVRTRFPDASHHCWAYRLRNQNQTRSSDDGEPGGSAGRPILSQIEGHELFDVIVIVTRYFGGTKLGVGGLIQAYGGSAGKALDVVVRRDVRETETLVISFDYELTKAVEAVFRTHNLAVKETTFDAKVQMHLEVPIEEIEHVRDALIQRTAGKVVFSSDESPK